LHSKATCTNHVVIVDQTAAKQELLPHEGVPLEPSALHPHLVALLDDFLASFESHVEGMGFAFGETGLTARVSLADLMTGGLFGGDNNAIKEKLVSAFPRYGFVSLKEIRC
jgi:hypothetical protein